ncbi:MAG: phage BR0599 family protein [Candidatus Cloacimonas sp.]
MKTITSTYEAQETAVANRGAELYRVFNDSGDIGYYTDASIAIVYSGRTYLPASIKRSSLEFDSSIGVSKMKVQFVWSDTAITGFISQNPVEIIWIEVLRTYLDLNPIEINTIFIGQIKNVAFQGIQAEAECISLEFYLNVGIPDKSYQRLCNHFLYDIGCTVLTATYRTTATVSGFGATSNIVYCSNMVPKEANYYTHGYIEARGTTRMIVAYEVNADHFTLIYPIPTLIVGDSINILPGCDRTGKTCLDKFDNMINFLGFEYIPFDNPTLWTA